MQELPVYASIGALIIDDIVYQDGTQVTNVLGGGGVFAIYGMRLWHTKACSKKVGYIIHTGFDYPSEIDDQIKSLNISLVDINHKDKHTTRGLNIFGVDDHRDFEYKHPIIRTTTSDFPDDWIKSVKILHLISSPERAIEIVDEWKEREAKLKSEQDSKTEFLWEPLPWACLPENLDHIYDASRRTEIITPNHEEIADMQGLNFKQLLAEHNNDFKLCVEYCASKFLDGIDFSKKDSNLKTLVVRASKFGTMVVSHCRDGANRKIDWVPAYWSWWDKDDQTHVKDVTGAGNSFCGGFAYAWVKTNGDPVESTYYGAVAASYAIEKMGVPSFHIASNGDELWNQGPSPADRLGILKSGSKTCRFI